jgi:DNA-binding NtrC family response regulator
MPRSPSVEAQRRYILRLLDEEMGDRRRVAARMAIAKTALDKRINELEITPEERTEYARRAKRRFRLVG